jgi:hypothetical protein
MITPPETIAIPRIAYKPSIFWINIGEHHAPGDTVRGRVVCTKGGKEQDQQIHKATQFFFRQAKDKEYWKDKICFKCDTTGHHPHTAHTTKTMTPVRLKVSRSSRERERGQGHKKGIRTAKGHQGGIRHLRLGAIGRGWGRRLTFLAPR